MADFKSNEPLLLNELEGKMNELRLHVLTQRDLIFTAQTLLKRNQYQSELSYVLISKLKRMIPSLRGVSSKKNQTADTSETSKSKPIVASKDVKLSKESKPNFKRKLVKIKSKI